MPKTPTAQPSSPSKLPANANPQPNSAGADKLDKMSEIALRKKKNADAQAAFRARRANYIATLEETVTSLEAVVVQLQDSCREARAEASDLRQDNQRLSTALETLRHECRERDKYLRALWHARKSSDDPHLDDFPPPPPSFNAMASNSNQGTASSSLGTPVTTPLPNPLAYSGPSSDSLDPRMQQYTQDTSAPLQQTQYHDASANAYSQRSPALQFMAHETDANGRASATTMGIAKMNQYAFNGITGQVRENPWHSGVNQAAPSGGDSVTGENGSSNHSPAFIPSPTITSAETTYGPRYPPGVMDAHKSGLSGVDQVSYLINGNDRSMSPTVSSPHNGSSASSVNSQFQFVFPTESQERSDPDYHRRMTAPAPELTLHGGTADVSVYAMNRRRAATGPDRPMLGGPMPSFRPGDPHAMSLPENNKIGSEDARASRKRRNTLQSNGGDHSSRSPSPAGHPPISSTLAVIKAQAFGALRRTRARPKKATEGAAKMAMEVLEARGIGLGINAQSANKRARLSDDDGAGLVNQS